MSFNNEQLIFAFKKWLQSQQFYTGEDGDSKLSHWDGYMTHVGFFALSVAVDTLMKKSSSSGAAIPNISSAKDAEKAEPELTKLRNEFDFAGFKTKWSSPLLVLGLLADSLSVSEIKSILARIPKQVGSPLKKYSGYTFFGKGGNLRTEILLVYTNSEICRQHSMQVLPDATSVNKPWGTIVRASCIDINNQTLEMSLANFEGIAKFFGTNKNDTNDPRKMFKKNKLDGVVAFLMDKSK
jgi:hypothetical protein